MNSHIVLKQSVIAVAFALAAQAALAQQTDSKSTATVYVTGSNLKRTAKEGTAPVQVITAKDMRDSGATTVTELMQLVPSMGTDQNLDTNDGGFARGVSTASLRGLSSSATLILLNGRRMTPSAYADPNNGNSTLYDLNAIPMSALERVEIFKDGASAVYGSDAIGGVINFITKNNYRGAEVSARASANDDGKFRRSGTNFFWGAGDIDDNGYNVFVTADVSERQSVLRSDVRDIAYDQYVYLNNRYATPFGSTVSGYPAFYRESAPGSKNFSVNRNNMASRLIVNTSCDASRLLTGAANMNLPNGSNSVFLGRQFCNYDTNQFLEGAGAGKDASIMSRGVIKLGSNMKAFAEVAYTRSARDYAGAPITIGQSATTNFASSAVVDPFQAILEIGHPDNPFPNARASIGYRFENLRGGTRTVNNNTRLVTGLQGTAGTWDWETAVLYNGSQRDDIFYGRLYLPTLRKLNTGTSLAALSADPTLAHDVVNDNHASILHWDAKANTQFGQLAGGQMGLAAGVEVRREKLKMEPDALLASGQIFGLANSAIDGQRDVKSAFVELRTPFLKNFEMDFAGRADKYPGIKTNFVPKVGAKWTVTDTFAMRGTLARGFRAPALNQVTPGGSQFFESGIADPRRCEADDATPKPGAAASDCNKTAGGVGNANPDLIPEKSKSASFGLLWSPNSSMDFGLDFYKIRKEGEVALGTSFDALRHEDENPGLVQRDQNPLNQLRDTNGNIIPNTGPILFIRLPWTNQGATEVQGVDFDAAYRRNLGEWGAFSAKLTSSYMHKYTLAQNPGDVEHNLAGYNAGLVDWNLSSGIYLPRWKSNLSMSLANGPHAFNVNFNFVGEVSLMRKYDKDETYATPFCHYGAGTSGQNRAAGNPNYEQHFPGCEIDSWLRMGVGYTYTGIKNLSVNFNIQNVFDTPAPYDPGAAVSTTTGAPLAGYNSSLHNPYGRYFSVQAKYSF